MDFTGDSLNLAGGDRNSGNYVTLPDGLFDGQDTVTVSLWINNHNTQGNTAAFFFGSQASGVTPSSYFLLNPCAPAGNYKAVFTNSVNASQPWTTEVGINDSAYATTGYMNQWKLYTVVIDGNSMAGYLDGEMLEEVSMDRTVSRFRDRTESPHRYISVSGRSAVRRVLPGSSDL